ncbi:hypothetical protein LIPSTDRAFT_159244 [Lipomyces starkeyi NRRL Y-11557]|uniref:Uncharacterized protein n=1 Tax=Lipomyces starkeyi NRRL Y-11557 TaxID=675824 RepID=A0A1E3PZX7_LIPST|nr:hypothetical protein LIPSTDRAFT_159244 [Lipomyces starkeyi NRRL Y-11557]
MIVDLYHDNNRPPGGILRNAPHHPGMYPLTPQTQASTSPTRRRSVSTEKLSALLYTGGFLSTDGSDLLVVVIIVFLIRRLSFGSTSFCPPVTVFRTAIRTTKRKLAYPAHVRKNNTLRTRSRPWWRSQSHSRIGIYDNICRCEIAFIARMQR